MTRHKEKSPKRNFGNHKALGYFLSLPERGLRSTGAMAGGLVREISAVVLPASFRRTRLYQSLVDTSLRFVVEQVGRVEKSEALQPGLVPDFVLRRTAGNAIEIMGLLLFRLSPVWVLAALSDLSNTGKVLTREIAETLKENGLLEKDREFAPYLKAAATHFSPAQSTCTEKFLHWCLGRINSAQFRKKTSNNA